MAVAQIATQLTTGSGVTATFTNPTTAGSLIVAVGVTFNKGTAFANGDVTDSKSNTYTLHVDNHRGFGLPGSGIWYNDGGTRGSSHTVTFNDGSGTNIVVVYEITGQAASPADATTKATGTDAATPFDVTAAAAISGSQIAIYGVGLDTGATATWSPPTGYTEGGAQGNGAGVVGESAYKLNETGTPTVGGAWAGGGVSAGAEVFATFKLAAASGGTVVLADATASASGATIPYQIGYIKQIGTVANTTGATTAAITVAAPGVVAGDTIVISGSSDNSGTNGAVQTISVADNSAQAGTANTYTVQTPHGIADPGAANAGQEGWLAVCVVTRPLATGDTITTTFANSTAAKAIRADQYSGVLTSTPVLAGTYTHTDNQTTTSTSVAASPNAPGQAFIGAVCVEGGTADSFTQDSDTTNGTWVNPGRIGAGTTTSGATLNPIYKIVTASGAQTYNPTLGTARDSTSVALVLDKAPITATAAVTLAGATAAASGDVVTGSGSGTVVLAAATIAATATETITGTAATTLAGVTVAASGGGYGAVTLAAATATATAVETISGTAGVTLAAYTVAATNITNRFVATASTNGHYLKDQLGSAILVCGNSPQNGVVNWTLANWDTFFADQQTRGFNASQIHAVYNFQADAQTSTSPFGNNSTLGSPGANYWATVDSVISKAATYGVTVFLTLIDNITCGASVASTTDANCYSYGTFLGNRYKTASNIVWVVGNDFDSSQYTARNPKYGQMVQGIRDAGDTHLLTVWNNTVAGNDNTYWDSIQSIDNGYAYDEPPYPQADTSYALTRTGFPKPFLWFEGTYYGELNALPGPPNATNLELRKLAWWTVTWGGVGHFFGTNKTWQGTMSQWQTETSGATAIYSQLARIPALFATLTAWETMVPDRSHVFQTGGRGTFNGGSLDTDTFAAVAYIPSGKVAIGYFPSSRSGITFDTTKLSGTVTAYWLDPTNGSTSTISNPAAPTYPGNNAAGDPDWVIVFAGTTVVTGTAAVTLAGATVAASATEKISGTAATTLANATVAASGFLAGGAGQVVLADFTAAASAAQTITGTAGPALSSFTVTASGIPRYTGTATVVLAGATVAASGTPTLPGTVAISLAAFTVAAAGAETYAIAGTVVLTGAAAQATGTETISGTGTVALAAATAAASGTVSNPTGTGGTVVLSSFTAAATGTETITGTITPTLSSYTATVVAVETDSGTSAITLAGYTAAAAGTERIIGTGGPELDRFTIAATGTAGPNSSVGTVHLADATITATGGELIAGAAAILLANAIIVAVERDRGPWHGSPSGRLASASGQGHVGSARGKATP